MVSSAYQGREQSLDSFLGAFLPYWETYQGWFREQTLASYFGLSERGSLGAVPAWAWVWPWSDKSPAEMKRWLPPRIRRNRRQNGDRIPIFYRSSKLMKFESLTSGESHGKQFFDLCRSLEEGGFYETCNSSDPFKVWVLEGDSGSRWVTYSGNHRVAAAVTTRTTMVHAESQGVVSKHNLHAWPNVQNGWFSRKEAEAVFDNVSEGRATLETEKLLSLLSAVSNPES